DGFPTYHLANVVDDHAMEITHVIRAEEWISSTPLHRLLYKAFGWEPPVFCHMPLLRNQGGGKISKRKNPVSLDFYRALGVLPDAMVNFLGLQGYSMPDGVLEGGSEFFAPQTFIDNFELKRVTTSGPVFDLDKLRAINGLHIQKLSPEAFRAAVHGHVDSWLDRIGSLAQPRMSLLGDWGSEHSFYYAWQMPITLAAFEPATKRLDAAKVGEALGVFAEALQNLQPHEWTAAVLDEKSSGIAETFEWTAKKDRTAFFQAIRIATTGRTMTPPLGDTLAAMERYTVVSRVLAAVAVLGAK
ncbi:MAG: glutamate--tRNA ligase, partial [Planctomycetota bacterium]